MNWLALVAIAVVVLVSFSSLFMWSRRPVEGPRTAGSVLALMAALLLTTSISQVKEENSRREDMAEIGRILLGEPEADAGVKAVGRYLASRPPESLSPVSIASNLLMIVGGLALAFRPRWAMSARHRDLVDRIAAAQDKATREWLKTNPKGTGTAA